MKKFTLIAIAILALASVSIAGNILANGEISIAATATQSTNTATIGVYDAQGQDWSLVYGVALKNNSATTTVTTVKAVDLGNTTAIGAATTNTTGASSLINVVSAPIPAREVTLSVVIPTNATATTLEYIVYGK